eukprot:8311865-Alexandrium_andersonii.AAC.1
MCFASSAGAFRRTPPTARRLRVRQRREFAPIVAAPPLGLSSPGRTRRRGGRPGVGGLRGLLAR